MPLQIKAPQPQVTLPQWSNVFKSNPSMDWLSRQTAMPYEETYTHPEIAPGSFGMPLSSSQIETFIPQYGAPQPSLPSARMSAPQRDRWGSYDMNLVDPLGSFGALPSAVFGAGQVSGEATFADKSINLGNWPTRYLDYMYSVPAGWLSQITGMNMLAGPAKDTSGTQIYRFEENPDYWPAIAKMSDEDLRITADRSAQSIGNYTTEFSDQLFAVMKRDRDYQMGLSSGNEAIDYLAKRNLSWIMDMYSQGLRGGGVLGAHFENITPGALMSFFGGDLRQSADATMTQIPFVGTPLAKIVDSALSFGANPISPDVEKMWLQLTPQERQGLLQASGWQFMGTNMIVTWPLFSGFGAIMNGVRMGAGGAAAAANVARASEDVIAASRLAVESTLPPTAAAAANAAQIPSAWARLANVVREADPTGVVAALGLKAQAVKQLGSVSDLATNFGVGIGFRAPWVWKGYNSVLHASTVAMEAGLAVVASHYALEYTSPGIYATLDQVPLFDAAFNLPGPNIIKGYATQGLGTRIDYSQPITSSAFAAEIDQLGYFTGLFGLNRLVGWSVRGAGGMMRPIFGTSENRLITTMYGGSHQISQYEGAMRMPDETASGAFIAIPKQHAEAMAQASLYQGLRSWINAFNKVHAEKLARGQVPETAALSQAEREEAAATFMATTGAEGFLDAEAKHILNVINTARLPTSLLERLKMDDQQTRDLAGADKIGRHIDDMIAEHMGSVQGASYWTQLLDHHGYTYNVEGIRRYIGDLADRIGWQVDLAALDRMLGKDPAKWQRAANWYSLREYMMTEAKVQAAEKATGHEPTHFVMRSNHMFTDRIDLQLTAIDQRGGASPLMPDDELSAAIARSIRSTPEAGRWYTESNWSKVEGMTPEGILTNDKALAAYREFLDHQRPMSPNRVPLDVASPKTEDLPVNALARELGLAGDHYSIAYKTLDRNYIARRATFIAKPAVRVSQGMPDGYTMNVNDIVRNVPKEPPDHWWDPANVEPTIGEVLGQADLFIGPGSMNGDPHFDLYRPIIQRYTDRVKAPLDAATGMGPTQTNVWILLDEIQNARAGVRIIDQLSAMGHDYAPLETDAAVIAEAERLIAAIPQTTMITSVHGMNELEARLLTLKDFIRRRTALASMKDKTSPKAARVLGSFTPEAIEDNYERSLAIINTDIWEARRFEVEPIHTHSFPDHLNLNGVWHSTVADVPVLKTGLKAPADLTAEYRATGEEPPVGLGSIGEREISCSPDKAVADMIAHHTKVVVQAAHGEIGLNEIVDEFWPYFLQGIKKANPGLSDAEIEQMGVVAMWKEMGQYRDMAAHPQSIVYPDSITQLKRWMAPEYLAADADTEEMFTLAQRVENSLPYSTKAGVYNSYEQALRVDPNQISVLRLAVRKGANWVPGLDGSSGEIRFRPEDVWVVDPRAESAYGGQRANGDPAPLSTWQPWDGPIEDVTAPTGQLRAIEHVRLKFADPVTGEEHEMVLDAPHLDYPLAAPNVALGNRTLLGRKIDDLFMGWRSWKMGQLQNAQVQRLMGGRYAFTATQIDEFIKGIRRMASQNWSPFGGHFGFKEGRGPFAMPLANPQLLAQPLIRMKDVQKLGVAIFGPGEKLNRVTGKLEVPDYPRLVVNGFRQAYHMNLTAGVTSRLYSMNPRFSWLAILTGQYLVPILRYMASPVFKSSELLESSIFNLMRGAHLNPRDAKVLRDYGLMPSDTERLLALQEDPFAQGLPTRGGGGYDVAEQPLDMTGLPGPEAVEEQVHSVFMSKARKLVADIYSPNSFKGQRSFELQATLMRQDMAGILKRNDPNAYKVIHDLLKVPDDEISVFIMQDRMMYQAWQNGKVSLDELTGLASKYNPALRDDPEFVGKLEIIYNTPDWAALEGLLRINAATNQAEAFGVHYFGSYRSFFERSVNHPVLGVYPASWAYKAVKEWARFMYDNRTFGDGALRLGSTPAVVLSNLTNQLAMYAAQAGQQPDWATNTANPMSESFFLFNLLLPGDWTSIPFPMSRSIRTIIRDMQTGTLENPTKLVTDNLVGPNNRGGIGVLRDINLFFTGAQKMYKAWMNPSQSVIENLEDGLTPSGKQRRATPAWDKLTKFPDGTAYPFAP